MPVEKVRRCHDEKIWQVEVLAGKRTVEIPASDESMAGEEFSELSLFDKNKAEPAESGLVSDHAPVEVELGALS